MNPTPRPPHSAAAAGRKVRKTEIPPAIQSSPIGIATTYSRKGAGATAAGTSLRRMIVTTNNAIRQLPNAARMRRAGMFRRNPPNARRAMTTACANVDTDHPALLRAARIVIDRSWKTTWTTAAEALSRIHRPGGAVVGKLEGMDLRCAIVVPKQHQPAMSDGGGNPSGIDALREG